MGLKSSVKRALFGPLGNAPRPIKHGLLKGNRFYVDTTSKTMRLLGLDEREVAADTRNFAAKAVTAFDIGANDGWYSLFFASQPNIKKVYAFEPEAWLKKDFEANFALNDSSLLNKVEFIPKMVGNQNNDQWCSIDELVPDLALPAVFKIDVDGGEMDVFRGGEKTFSKPGCSIVLETHTIELEKECQTFLKDHGYRTRIITPSWYRTFIPEGRVIAHNQWLVASRD